MHSAQLFECSGWGWPKRSPTAGLHASFDARAAMFRGQRASLSALPGIAPGMRRSRLSEPVCWRVSPMEGAGNTRGQSRRTGPLPPPTMQLRPLIRVRVRSPRSTRRTLRPIKPTASPRRRSAARDERLIASRVAYLAKNLSEATGSGRGTSCNGQREGLTLARCTYCKRPCRDLVEPRHDVESVGRGRAP